MREVELLRGSKIHQSGHRYFWTWKTKEDGQSIWYQSKWGAVDGWRDYATENGISNYKFVQKLKAEVK